MSEGEKTSKGYKNLTRGKDKTLKEELCLTWTIHSYYWIFRENPHQDRDDAFELLLHKITNNLVIEILHRLPLQTEKKNISEQDCICNK